MNTYQYSVDLSIKTDAVLPPIKCITEHTVYLSNINVYLEMCDWDCTIMINDDYINLIDDIIIPSKVKLYLDIYLPRIVRQLYYLDQIEADICFIKTYIFDLPKVSIHTLVPNDSDIKVSDYKFTKLFILQYYGVPNIIDDNIEVEELQINVDERFVQDILNKFIKINKLTTIYHLIKRVEKFDQINIKQLHLMESTLPKYIKISNPYIESFLICSYFESDNDIAIQFDLEDNYSILEVKCAPSYKYNKEEVDKWLERNNQFLIDRRFKHMKVAN